MKEDLQYTPILPDCEGTDCILTYVHVIMRVSLLPHWARLLQPLPGASPPGRCLGGRRAFCGKAQAALNPMTFGWIAFFLDL